MADFEYESRDLEVMSFAQKYHEWIVSFFRDYLGKRVAEVGAGSGNFSALLLREPLEELVAIEPSENVYRLLEQHTAEDARVTARNAFFAEVSGEYADHFDSIVYVNVLEHVEDDAAELARVYAALRPGGYVCVFVPALSWLYSEHDASIGHFRRYHKAPLEMLLRGVGFEVVRSRYFDIVGILPWLVLLKWKLMKGDPTAGNIALYDTYVVPVSRVLETLVSPPIGKNLLIVGKKPE